MTLLRPSGSMTTRNQDVESILSSFVLLKRRVFVAPLSRRESSLREKTMRRKDYLNGYTSTTEEKKNLCHSGYKIDEGLDDGN